MFSEKDKVLQRVTTGTLLDVVALSKIAKDDLDFKRLVLEQVSAMLQFVNTDYIIVVEGASITHTTKKGIIKDLRTKLKEYEISIGEDPNKSWK